MLQSLRVGGSLTVPALGYQATCGCKINTLFVRKVSLAWIPLIFSSHTREPGQVGTTDLQIWSGCKQVEVFPIREVREPSFGVIHHRSLSARLQGHASCVTTQKWSTWCQIRWLTTLWRPGHARLHQGRLHAADPWLAEATASKGGRRPGPVNAPILSCLCCIDYVISSRNREEP